MNAEQLLEHFERISDAPDAISRLRSFILEFAVRGKLVLQDQDEEPASVLLARIQSTRTQLEKSGQIKKAKSLPLLRDDEKPFTVPAGWVWARIRQITADRGQSIPDKDFTYIDVTAINKEVGIISDATVVTAADAPSRARKLVAKGDVLYSCVRPYLLNIAIINDEIEPAPIASTAFAVLYGFGLVLPKYLWIALRSPFMIECVESKMRGQAYPAINDSDFALLPIPLPPLAEQHRIVAKVDELMGLCDRLEAAQYQREACRTRLTSASLARLNQPAADAPTFHAHVQFHLNHLSRFTAHPDQIKSLRQTILNLAVRGKLVEQDPTDEPAAVVLDELRKCRKATSGQTRSSKRIPVARATHLDVPDLFPSSWALTHFDEVNFIVSGVALGKKMTGKKTAVYPYLRVANVQRGYLDLAVVKTIEISADEFERYQLQPRDVLMTEGGDWDKLGRAAIWQGEVPDCIHQNHIYRIRSAKESLLSPAWLMLFANSPLGRSYFEGASKQTTNLASINMTQLRSCPLPLPPTREQHRIVAKVEELLALCDRLETQLTTTQTQSRRLLEATLHQALAPALDGVDPVAT